MTHNPQQVVASDPRHSVWVSASAGTGKTKVLTDRVLRLLLSGVPFEKILCLTFTNAAASEMLNRITDTLFRWQKEEASLKTLLGRDPSPDESHEASKLFTRYILSPHQLSIYTIHSFAQKILQKFPFEAGLYPGFKILNSMDSEDIVELVIKDLGLLLRGSEESELNSAIEFLLRNLHENTFHEMIREIVEDRLYFQNLFKQFDVEAEYAQFLKREVGICEDISSLIDRLWVTEILGLQDPLSEYIRKKDLAGCKGFFLTSAGQPRKKLLSKKDKDKNPSLESRLLHIQDLVWKIDQQQKTMDMIEATAKLFTIAKYIINRYSYHKSIRGVLDYSDLIYYTDALLNNSSVRDWVLYKLDGGIDHLLVDEAQDTSPEQWHIITAIMQEFYSGETDTQRNRTLFVVGDDKQSIYSFQGADVENFTQFNQYIKKRMTDASKPYLNVSLEWSYRSSVSVVEFVRNFLKKYKISELESEVKCFREKVTGAVELWPLYVGTKSSKELFWPTIDEMEVTENALQKFANDIAQYIKNYLSSGRVLASTGKAIEPGDVMILVRKRGSLMNQIIHSLKEHGVDVAGVDRITLTDHISIQDILALLKHIAMPRDNLNLAALLKGPLGCVSEQELKELVLLAKSIRPKEWILQEALTANSPIAHILVSLSAIANATNLSQFLYILLELLGFRRILVEANGESTHDVLDELLNLSQEFSRDHGCNIQEFIYWMGKREVEVKRDVAQQNRVRVMTIHGAKGLEAPVVILPDTTSVPSEQKHILWQNNIMYWLGGGNSNEAYRLLKERANNSLKEEYLRLLYVALTRAEDHLIIAGTSANEQLVDECFYQIASNIISGLNFKEREHGVKYIGEDIDFSHLKGSVVKEGSENVRSLVLDKDLLNCLVSLKTQNNIQNESVVDPTLSPLYSRISLSYGEFLHKILEDSVKTGNFDFSPEHPMVMALEGEERDHIISKIERIFHLEEFMALLKNTKIYTEISVGYKVGEQIKVGRIDLLSVGKEHITIVDYKTDKKPPENQGAVPTSYKEQLSRYASAVSKIYPAHKVLCKILWVESGGLMEVEC